MSYGRLETPTCDRCGKQAQDIREATTYGWDWFTGYLPKTFHYCYRCLTADPRGFEHQRRIAMTEAAT